MGSELQQVKLVISSFSFEVTVFFFITGHPELFFMLFDHSKFFPWKLLHPLGVLVFFLLICGGCEGC